MGISQGIPSSSGPFNGGPPARFITGQTYLPYGMMPNGNTHASTINDLFYYPFPLFKTQTFTGGVTWNGGAGDNGELIRLGVYADDSASGGPGTLLKDFGAVTLSAASAKRTALSSVTLSGPAFYWLAISFQTSATMFYMSDTPQVSGVGFLPQSFIGAMAGFKLTAAPSATYLSNKSFGLYVNTAYGAFAATAVAPTSEISVNASGAAGVSGADGVPIMGLIV